MPIYTLQGPDGKTYKIEGPAGATAEQLGAVVAGQQPAAAPDPDAPTPMGTLGNIRAGAIKGASQIGATLLAPVDAAARALGVENDYIGRTDRRAASTAALQELGADPNSLAFKGGQLAAEIAGTAGAGSAVAVPLRAAGALAPAAAPVLNRLATAAATGGFNAGGAAGAAGVATRAAGGALSGAAGAGLVDPSTAGTGAVIGGALPVAARAVGQGAQAVGRAVRGAPASPEVAALAQRAEQLGIQVPADRIADSRPLNALAAALNYVPGSGRQAVEQRMVRQLNQKLSQTFGQNDANVTAALRRADQSLGQQFDNFLQANTVKMDQQFLTDLADAANMASKELGSDGARIIANQVDEIIAKAGNGVIDGQAAYNIKRTLDRIGKRNAPEAFYALDLKGKLMEALDRSVGQTAAQGFKELRSQYGSMLQLQKLAANGAEGEISAARLANVKNINNPQIQELADIAAQFVRGREGAHGAAQRAAAGAITLGVSGAPALAAGMVTGRAANMALDSQAARNAALGISGPPNRLLEAVGPAVYRAAPVIAAE